MALTQTPEEGLKVSNAPSDGKFLQYKDSTDKLTWATVSTTDSTKMPLAGGTFTGDVTWDNGTNAGKDMVWDESDDTLKFSDDVQISLGSDRDVRLYHTGSHGYINVVTGDLNIRTNSTEPAIVCTANGSVAAYYDNAKKFETSATGATVTGTLAATAVTGDGSGLTNLPSSAVGRNLLYNGEMQISQRATSSTSYGYQTLDRWKTNVSVGAFTTSQDTESPNGFSKSLKLDCTTADGSPSAGDNISIQQHLEGYDLQGIKAGTSDAETLTLSFWVRCTKTGVFNTILYQKDGNKFAVQNTTISSANTWEKKTFTVTGNTADAIANDNTKSLTVEFWLDAGSNYRGGTVSGSWNTWADTEAGEGITLDLADNTSNDFYITGVKLEMGSSATDYDYQSYADELHRCHRYCCIVGDRGVDIDVFATVAMYTNTDARVVVTFPRPMRASPSGTISSGTDFWVVIADGSIMKPDSAAGVSARPYHASIQFTDAISSSGGKVGVIEPRETARMLFESEL